MTTILAAIGVGFIGGISSGLLGVSPGGAPRGALHAPAGSRAACRAGHFARGANTTEQPIRDQALPRSGKSLSRGLAAVAGRGLPRGWRRRRARRGKGPEPKPAVELCRLSCGPCRAARAAFFVAARPGHDSPTGEKHPGCGAAHGRPDRGTVRRISGDRWRTRDRCRSHCVPEGASAPGADDQPGRVARSDDAACHVHLLARRPAGTMAGPGGSDCRPLGWNWPWRSIRQPREPGYPASLTDSHG
jgi:hypothetical protein